MGSSNSEGVSWAQVRAQDVVGSYKLHLKEYPLCRTLVHLLEPRLSQVFNSYQFLSTRRCCLQFEEVVWHDSEDCNFSLLLLEFLVLLPELL